MVAISAIQAAEAALLAKQKAPRPCGNNTLLAAPVVAESLSRHAVLTTVGVPTSEKAYVAEVQDGCDAAHRFKRWLNKAFACYERIQAKHIASLRVPNLIADLLRPNPNNTNKITGRDRLAIIKKALDSFGLDRSDTQREFHDCMICACAMIIFRDDLDDELDDLLQEYGITELQSEFMAITPRRWGKTYSVAMFVVAMLLGVEAVGRDALQYSIFSTGRRASQKMLELIYAFICKIPGMKEMIIKHNVETIWIQGPHGVGDVRKCFSYPSKVKISNRVCVGCVG